MAATRRSVFAVGLSYASTFLSSSRVTRQRLAGLPTVMRKNWISLSVAGGLCAVPFVQKQVETISHEALIRRASSLVTDSSNTYLSQTTLALVDSLTQYVKAMHSLMALQKRYVASVSKLIPAEEDAVWQVIIRQRQEVTDRREDCKRYESNWMTAINLSELAAEAAYNAGADQASVMARTSLQVAQSHVEQVRQLSLEAENDLMECKAEDSERIQLSAVTATEEEGEEDIPEAYLRED